MANRIYVIESKDPETGHWRVFTQTFHYDKEIADEMLRRIQNEIVDIEVRQVAYTREEQCQSKV